MAARYVIGVDFGTLSARAVLVDARNGRELAQSTAAYKHGVIEESLPGAKSRLKSHTALQDPQDYLAALTRVVRSVVKSSGVAPSEVAAIGTDFTACTVLPVFADGRPLTADPRLRRNPHSWVKLWKHHAAQPEADRINEVGRERDETFLGAYGGKYSSEWFFSKVLETVREAPGVYAAAERFIEAGDWIVWQLCGVETRNEAAAGFKGMRVYPNGRDWTYPSADLFEQLHPSLTNVIQEKVAGRNVPLGSAAGTLTPGMARVLGLPAGIPVAAGNIDAHAGVPACGVTEPGKLVMIMGTSTCHLLIGEKRREVEGICGVVQNGIVPGLWGYEAGQAGVGDLFAWFVEHCAPALVTARAGKSSVSVHDYLTAEAARLAPGEAGLLALDWWNGNRSILVDAELSGLLIGPTLQTRPPEIYRSLLEATAFGTRKIIEAFDREKIAIDELHACGGLARRNPLLLQIYADVIQRPILLAGAQEASALGSAIHAATAARIYPDLHAAARKMAPKPERIFRPRRAHAAVYDDLYSAYSELHDLFGRANPLMKRLLKIRTEAKK